MDNQKMPIVAIVGRPNVGKSTLFNRLVGKRQAITAKEAGTTRDAVTAEASWNGKSFILIDTAGLLFDFYGFEEEDIEKKAQDKLLEVLESADIILFLIDQKVGVTAEDKQGAALIRRFSKKIILVLNKADDLKYEDHFLAQELGIEQKIAVSSITGRRTGLLLDLITKDFAPAPLNVDRLCRISIVGRPNAGKSTIFNLLSGKDVAIVSDVFGTTRDSIKIKIRLNGKQAEIIDTAGFRKQGKIQVGIEKFSIMRAIESIMTSDIVLLVIDAKEGFTRTDAHLASLGLRNGKKLLVIVNKIDLLENKTTDEIKDFDRYGFIRKNQIIAISAKDKTNFSLLVRHISLLI